MTTTTFTIEIKDEHLHGVASARLAYNEQGLGVEDFIPLETDEEYFQFVMENAALSYHNQYPEE